MEDSAGPTQNPGLNSFGGNQAPARVSTAVRHLAAFPDAALDDFWGLLGPVLREPEDPGHPERLQRFCREHAVADARVLEVIQACETLLHQAVALDLDAHQFDQDLTALAGSLPLRLDPLAAQLDTLREELRGRILQETLADHGKVLVGLDWRVDRVASSDRGIALNGTVVMLTLRYREGDRLDRITLQLTPETLAEIKRFAGRIEG